MGFFSETNYIPSEPTPCRISIVKKAEFVSLGISIKSDQKTTELKFQEMEQANQQIEEEARKSNLVRIHEEKVNSNETSKSFSPSKFSFAQVSLANMLLAVPLKENENFYTGVRALYNFIEKIKPLGKAKYTPGVARLGIHNPEEYRSALLQLIAEDVQRTKKILGGNGTVHLSGMENPVMLSQKDEQLVYIFINHSMKIEIA